MFWAYFFAWSLRISPASFLAVPGLSSLLQLNRLQLPHLYPFACVVPSAGHFLPSECEFHECRDLIWLVLTVPTVPWALAHRRYLTDTCELM